MSGLWDRKARAIVNDGMETYEERPCTTCGAFRKNQACEHENQFEDMSDCWRPPGTLLIKDEKLE